MSSPFSLLRWIVSPSSRIALAALALAACADRGPVLPVAGGGPLPSSSPRIECRVAVASGQMRCAELREGALRANLILGGQGERVRLATTATHYDGDSIFEGFVTVENLLDQEMGTDGGIPIYGVKVFFASGPAVTEGSGTVEVANADGVGTFTAAGQPYFHYHQILAPHGISQPAAWRFRVPPTVGEFAFTVLVETRLRDEQGVLRWERVEGAAAGHQALFDVWGSSADNVWAVGSYGAIVHGHGRAWSWVSTPVWAALYGVWGTDPYNVVAVGGSGTILRYDGNRWAVVHTAGLGTLTDVWAGGRGSYFAVGSGGDGMVILRSGDGGASWAAQFGTPHDSSEFVGPAPDPSQLQGVWGASPQEVYAVGFRVEEYNSSADAPAHGVILHTTDGGANWSERAFPDSVASVLYGVWGSSPEDVYAVGARRNPETGQGESIILHSADHGATWTSTRPGPGSGSNLSSVWGRSADDVYAFGAEASGEGSTGLVLQSTDRGATWSPVPNVAPRPAYGAWGTAEGELFLAAGTLHRFDGATWSEPDSPPSTNVWRGVWSPSAVQVVTVGQGTLENGAPVALIASSADGGATWANTTFTGSYEIGLSAITALSPSTLIAAGTNSGLPLVVRSTDGGGSWAELSLPSMSVPSAGWGLWATPGGTVYLAGTRWGPESTAEGVILRSADGGNSWSAAATSGSDDWRYLSGITGCPSGELYAVGLQRANPALPSQGLILRSVNGGLTWSETFTAAEMADQLSGVVCTASAVYAVGSRIDPETQRSWGVILRSADGAGWETEYAATTSASLSGLALNAIWAGANGEVYVGGTEGAMLRKSAEGWTSLETGVKTTFSAFSGTSDRGFFVVGDGVVLRGAR